jgi:hypothetical protein
LSGSGEVAKLDGQREIPDVSDTVSTCFDHLRNPVCLGCTDEWRIKSSRGSGRKVFGNINANFLAKSALRGSILFWEGVRTGNVLGKSQVSIGPESKNFQSTCEFITQI